MYSPRPPMSDSELSARALKLMLPTNPNVDPDVDPSRVEGGDFEYANPVALNNRIVFYANATIEGTDELYRLTAKQRAAKLGKRKAERQLDQFEERILRIHPAPKGNNTLKALTAHIQKAAFEKEDTGAQYEQLREDFETAEDTLVGIDSKLSQVRMWLDAIDAAQEAIRTHLSWVKADAGGGRRRG
jgi:hypothetical protein